MIVGVQIQEGGSRERYYLITLASEANLSKSVISKTLAKWGSDEIFQRIQSKFIIRLEYLELHSSGRSKPYKRPRLSVMYKFAGNVKD